MYGVFRTKLLTPTHSPLHPPRVSSPCTKGEGVHTDRAMRGWGVNILEDARHIIGLLQYNLSTSTSLHVCSTFSNMFACLGQCSPCVYRAAIGWGINDLCSYGVYGILKGAVSRYSGTVIMSQITEDEKTAVIY